MSANALGITLDFRSINEIGTVSIEGDKVNKDILGKVILE